MTRLCLINFYYFIGVLFGIFKFKFSNVTKRAEKSTNIKVYGIFIVNFLLFVGLPLSYIYYTRRLQERLAEVDKRTLKLVINLQFAAIIMAYCAFIKCVCYSRTNIADFVNEGLAMKTHIADCNEPIRLAKIFYRLIVTKTIFLDVVPHIFMIFRAYSTYNMHGDAKVFCYIFFAVSHSSTSMGVQFVNSAFIYCAYLLEILNVKMRNIIGRHSKELFISYREIDEILLFHDKIANFVLRLTKFTGILMATFIFSHFLTILTQVEKRKLQKIFTKFLSNSIFSLSETLQSIVFQLKFL